MSGGNSDADSVPLRDLEHWQRVKELLSTALDLDAERRPSYLDKVCGSDTALRAELQSLLDSYQEADDFMEGPTEARPELKPQDPVVGMRVGPYRVFEEIGHGGMGSVYRAVRADDVFRKQVAMKIVRRGMNHEFILRRFRHERQILATLEHPNVARLLDGGATEDGLPYFVMEYVAGEPIDDYCDRNRLTTRQRLELFLLVCSAVQAAHERKIVHRDIKPGNILINGQGQPKLLDFGIAKILDPDLATQAIEPTVTVLRLMTPEYASPEQVRGEEITAACDVYSLGVLLYELLTGHKPYRLKSRSPHEIASVICGSEPERPSTAVCRTELVTRGTQPAVTLTPEVVSQARQTQPDELRRALAGDLDNIILMAMRKEPARRYASADIMAKDIRRYLDGMPVRARKDTILYRLAKSVQRNRSAVTAFACALMLAIGAMFAFNFFFSTRNERSSKISPLTSFPGDETQPVFSPDGERLAFVWDGEGNDNSDIYVRPVAGGGLLRLTTNAAEDVSPAWAPDGGRIAWLRVTPTETSVFVSPASGGQHGKITFLYPTRIEAVGRNLDWSPDGKYLVAADKKTPDEPFRIVLIEVATGHKFDITSPPGAMIGDSNAVFSPDGKRVAFIRAVSSGVDDVFMVPVAGGEAERLTSDRRYVISLTWTHDGTGVLFSSNRTGNHTLWKANLRGGQPERVPTLGENASDPVYSRDGKKMAYSQFYVDSNIWRMEVNSGSARTLIASTQYDSSPQYSPDASRVAFRSSRSGYHEIWLADANGRNEIQLTKFASSLTGTPRWSPDGTKIVCDSRPEGQPDIFVVDVSSGKSERLTLNITEDVVPSWSRDGKWIYFASHRNGAWQVWKVPPTGGTAEQVTVSGGFAAFESPDGKYVYYAKGRSVPGLWRIPSSGGKEEVVLKNLKSGYWGYWGICPQGIFFADRVPGQKLTPFFLFKPSSGELSTIGVPTKTLIPGDSGLAVSPDCGNLLYAQVDQSGSDIMIAETR